MPDEIRFEEPPAGGGRGSHAETVEALRAQPGQWAVVATKATSRLAASAAQYIRNSRRGVYAPVGAFESMSRAVDVIKDGERVREFRVYARFVGETK